MKYKVLIQAEAIDLDKEHRLLQDSDGSVGALLFSHSHCSVPLLGERWRSRTGQKLFGLVARHFGVVPLRRRRQ